uniref:Uncharacterized protein n=1 Tax=Ananas comosus var. bracteatus TaxID=296719 RepID=A0A6V7QMK5_ANACO|nr:unnamed protein product [Ananas comosus var. bracteatus]
MPNALAFCLVINLRTLSFHVIILHCFFEHLTSLHYHSLLWVGPALLFSSATAVNMLGWDSKVRTIVSTSFPSSALVGALNDRLLLVSPTEINPRQKKGVEIRSCLVGLLEPILIGFSTMQQQFEQKIDLSEVLYQITSRFDRLRITPRSLDMLVKGPLYVEILLYHYPKLVPSSHRYGQFDSAKETFEVIADYESMLDLFICHLNPSAMRRLAQKLEEIGTDSELRRYLERILRIRSTGWTQGIFANFAAESMVPKGPEWGGGNWEIKTPTNMKSIPQWELAGEVMPYMKTSEGGIPAIVADHIGVYLGSIKGRGNVVDVSEKSLVQAFTRESNENKPAASTELALVQNKKGIGGDSVGDTLARQLGVAAASRDEQAKAEEEFKKSLYGVVDGGSSDEDETMSKTKKIHIRIRDKPISGSTIDVNKLKEATKQFSLGPPLRTKSSQGPSQDFPPISMQPSSAPTATMPSTAPDMFGTDSLTTEGPAQPNSMVTGMGVSAGPIPEDFFKNTISSLQVAASLPPPGVYLSRINQGAQVADGNRAATSQNVNQNVMTNIGLPDGGVPPQPIDLSSLETPGANAAKPPQQPTQPTAVRPGQVPRSASASVCFKTSLAHLEQNQLPDALSCLDEAFLALAKDQSRGDDIKAQATICAQYKIAVALLQEIARLQKVQGAVALSAKDEMARLSRHLASLPLQAKHRINCIRQAEHGGAELCVREADARPALL